MSEQLCLALDDEIKAATAKRHPIDLQGGIRLEEAVGPFLVYRFAGSRCRLPVGTRAHLVVGDRVHSATVLEPNDPSALLLGIMTDLGPSIPEAQLDASAVWLLRAQRERLLDVPPAFNSCLALAAIGKAPMPPLREDVPVSEILPGISFEFDEDKLAALAIALRAPVGFVWGPPGTGKTTLLAAVVEAHLWLGRRVLLLAPTNAAVDEAVRRVVKRLQCSRERRGKDPALKPGVMVRYGQADHRVRAECLTPVEVVRLSPEVISRARVLATTVHQAFLRPTLAAEFDVVILDEAGAATLVQAFWAAGIARQAVTFFGDFRQLGPVVESRTPRAQQWLARDIFAAAGVTRAVDQGNVPQYLGTLRTQFRMPSRICGVVSEVFYQGGLRTDSSMRRPDLPRHSVGQGAIITVVDTSRVATNPTRDGKRRGRINPAHLKAVRLLLSGMADEIPNRGDDGADRVVVLAPYRAQVGRHARWLRKRYPGKAVGASTIHMAQATETDTVILDLTDAPGRPLSAFLSAEQLQEEGARLLNVAISRARQRVVILANLAWLAAKAPARGVVAALLASLDDRSTLISMRDLE